ncbi:hypothetical protein EZS27_010916 [termite gut metagenome]|uniref:HIRAN domain-containing protein n=1 Tax=termite gut metagenome TaxID=433724 RepID=A0A5J4S7F2_9ZZZZ
MKHIKYIYLIWRIDKGERRIKIGIIEKNQTEEITFRYLKEGLTEAISMEFSCYPDFPDTGKTYNNNVLNIFGQRLNKSERSDIQKYYDYWEIEQAFKNDKYYLLAQTQGLLSTDNFEFVAEYNPIQNLRFISEICGLSHINLPSGLLNAGDELQWKLEKENSYDPYAVQLFKNGKEIGYVKTIHSKVFYHQNSCNIKIQVKSIEQNGYIKRVFIKILLLT